METPNKLYEGPAAWYGVDLAGSEDWIYRLSQREIAEIETSVKSILQRDMEIVDIRREDFPLPTLGKVLADIQNEVVNGRGFVLIRGVPVEYFSIREAAIAYWGMERRNPLVP